MTMIEFSMRRPVTVSMATVALLVFGMVLLGRLGLTLLPDLSYPTLTVRTQYPGAAPSEIENLISKPIEESVGVIKGVRTVKSISRAGQSDVLLEFNWGTDMGLAGIDVREKLDLVQLPLDIERPQLLRFNPSLDPIVRMSLTRPLPEGKQSLELQQKNLTSLRRLADEQLKKQLESVEGVAAVKVSGGYEDEVQVNIDQKKLSQLKLSIEQIAEHLKSENVNLSGGRLEEGSQQFLVRTINQYKSVEEMAGTIVATVEGKPVYLRDIADVAMRYKERVSVTRIGHDEAVEIALYKEGDANTVAVSHRVSARLDEIKKNLGSEIHLDKIYDQSRFIEDAINEVVHNGIEGGILSFFILYLFLRNFRATVIISLTIPISVIISFNLMFAFGVTLNIMSLGGLAMSIGMMIDDAIVVLENIDRHRALGQSAWESAKQGTLEVAGAVTASSTTTVAVFLPIIFVQGVAGQLFRDQALTVCFAQIVSLISSFSLVPMLAVIGQRATTVPVATSEELPRKVNVAAPVLGEILRAIGALSYVIGKIMTPIVNGFNRAYNAMADGYRRLLAYSLHHGYKVLLIATVLFGIGVWMMSRLGVELIPELAQGEFVVTLHADPGTPLLKTDVLLQKAAEIVQAHPQVERTFAVTGAGSRLDASPDKGGENVGELDVVLKKPVSQSRETVVMRELRDQLKHMAGVIVQIERRELFTFSTPLEIEIAGYNLEKLQQLSDKLLIQMRANDRFADVRSTIEEGHPELQIHFDHERAAALGLSVPDVAARVVKKLRGEVATRYAFHDRKIDVVVRANENDRNSMLRVGELLVNEDKEHPIPLSAVADIVLGTGPSEIHRVSQERVAVISAQVRYGDLGEAAQVAQSMIDTLPRMENVDVRVAGQNADMQDSFQTLKYAFAFALFLVYLVMAAQFESLLHPFVIMFSVPLATVGSAIALTATGQTINVVVFIGLIMLAGVVVKNAIVLLDRVNQLRESGVDTTTAILEAGPTRLRPIVMTMMTTVLGMLPLALGIGEGAEIRAPMAITVIGGLIVSTFLTLVVIPVMYQKMNRH